MNISQLNDDCLYHIFRSLTFPKDKLNFSEVCKRWQNISKSSWKGPKLKITFNQDLRSLQKCEIFTHYDFEKSLEIIAPTLNEISLCLPSRKSNFTSVEFFPGVYVLRNFQMFEALSFLSKVCYNVRIIKVDLAKFFVEKLFADFLDQNKDLDELVVEGNYDCHLDNLDNGSCDFVKSLERLTLIDYYYENDLESFFKQAKNLEELKIIGGLKTRSKFLKALSTHATQLKKFHFEGNVIQLHVPIDPNNDMKLLAKLTDLEELCLKDPYSNK